MNINQGEKAVLRKGITTDHIKLENVILEQVKKYKYLGSDVYYQ